MNALIWTKYNSLDSGFCKHVIDKFEKDDNKKDGVTGSGVVNKSVKSSIDLNISGYPHWKEENDEFQKNLREGMREYREYVQQINPQFSPITTKIRDSGFQIQRTDPGGGYTWHSDFHFFNETNGNLVSSNIRTLTYIFYLNTVPDFDGGYTEFVDGTKIVSDQAKLLIFPSTWTYVHRGFPPNKTKYIATGWIYDVIKTPIVTPNQLQLLPPEETRNNYIKVKMPQ